VGLVALEKGDWFSVKVLTALLSGELIRHA